MVMLISCFRTRFVLAATLLTLAAASCSTDDADSARPRGGCHGGITPPTPTTLTDTTTTTDSTTRVAPPSPGSYRQALSLLTSPEE